MKKTAFLLVGSLFFAAAGCESSGGGGVVEKSSSTYGNSFDFVWESASEELKGNFTIAKADRASRTLTTDWNLTMSPFSQSGRRDRLIVTLVPAGGGWQATARQETEVNANEKDPLNPKEAKWKEGANDGGLAARFLQNLDTRLQPDERWRDRLAR